MNEKIKKILSLSLRLLFAFAIIVFLTRGNKVLITKTICSIEPTWFAIATIFYFSSFLVCVARWRSLLKMQNINLSFANTLILALRGMFFSLIIPGSVGGDIAKAGFISAKAGQGYKTKAVFSILIDRIVGLLGLFLLASLLGIICFRRISEFANSARLIIFVLIAGIVIGMIGAAMIFFHRTIERIPVLKTLIALTDKYGKGLPSHLMEALDGYKKSSIKIILWIICSALLVHSMQGLAVFSLIKGTGEIGQKAHYVVLASSLSNAIGAVPLTPSGLGTRDAAMSGLLQLSGMKEEKALSVAIMYTGLIIIFNLLAGLSLFHSEKKL